MSLPDAASLEAFSLAELREVLGRLVGEVRRLHSDNVALQAGAAAQQATIAVLRTENQALRDEVARLKGLPPRPPSRPSGMEQATQPGVGGKYARAEVFPERVLRTPAPSIIDPYLPHLERRASEGCENGTQLWREVRVLGFAGTAKQVRRWLQAKRTALHKHTPRRWRDVALPGAMASLPTTRKLLAPIQLAWLIVKAVETRSAEEAKTIVHIEQDTEAATLVRLVRRFVDLARAAGITGKRQPPGVDTFDAWLADARLQRACRRDLRSGSRA